MLEFKDFSAAALDRLFARFAGAFLATTGRRCRPRQERLSRHGSTKAATFDVKNAKRPEKTAFLVQFSMEASQRRKMDSAHDGGSFFRRMVKTGRGKSCPGSKKCG